MTGSTPSVRRKNHGEGNCLATRADVKQLELFLDPAMLVGLKWNRIILWNHTTSPLTHQGSYEFTSDCASPGCVKVIER